MLKKFVLDFVTSLLSIRKAHGSSVQAIVATLFLYITTVDGKS